MTIKTQLRALLVVIGVIFASMFGIIAQSNRVTEQYQARSLKMTQVMKEVFEFNIAASDYLRKHHDRALYQMDIRIKSLSKQLETVSFKHTERQAILTYMYQELERTNHVFQKLKDSHTKFHEKYGVEITEQVDFFAHQEIEALSLNLSISSLTLVNSTNRLIASLAESQTKDLKFYDRILMGEILVSFVLLSLSIYLFSRRLIFSVYALKDGAARIVSGDLGYRVQLVGNDELTDLTASINEMTKNLQESYESLEDEIEERKRTEESLLKSEQVLRQNEENINKLNYKLENQLIKLGEANRELESFTYSVSHDLRAPLRHVTGFVEMLNRKDSGGLDDKSKHYLKVISGAATKMSCLIDDLLSFSRMGRGEMMKSSVDLKQLTQEVIEEIPKDPPPGRKIKWRIGELPVTTGDEAMLRLVMANLISNAVKYSNNVETPIIEVDVQPPENGSHVLYVRDNGAGFDMKYVDKLFGLFQRLHSSEEYEGTGVGLANVRRIVGRHGGRTWAEGELNKGATFYFTLPYEKEE